MFNTPIPELKKYIVYMGYQTSVAGVNPKFIFAIEIQATNDLAANSAAIRMVDAFFKGNYGPAWKIERIP